MSLIELPGTANKEEEFYVEKVWTTTVFKSVLSEYYSYSYPY